ncbi:MAG TPA: long-chain fatty acid--CoA ligase [Clostridia bacterium]|nr:long-chain fatty acid--CoA ligase [Clostridia bacterium]
MDFTCKLSAFAAQMREFIARSGEPDSTVSLAQFEGLALELFALQFAANPAYRRFCESRGAQPGSLRHWSEIPAVPTAAFKDWDFTCLPPPERTAVFHSSGTTAQRPSRHFHCAESLELYRHSAAAWFASACPEIAKLPAGGPNTRLRFLFLTPSPEQAPHSSLVDMFHVWRERFGAAGSRFFGRTDADGNWSVACEAVVTAVQPAAAAGERLFIAGTAYSFVHLADYLVEHRLKLRLPAGSAALETGGYKGRSRVLAKDQLHALMSERLEISPKLIGTEYGMCELSSQGYAQDGLFRFPPWARVRVVSPETGETVREGELGLIRVFDLANVYSVLALQTEDIGRRRGEGFELIGRAELAEPRGCSLMSV